MQSLYSIYQATSRPAVMRVVGFIAISSFLTASVPAQTNDPATGDSGTTAIALHGPTASSGAYAEMMKPMHTMHEAMNAAKSSGNPDKDFVLLMVPHHQAAVDMSKAYLNHGKSDRLRKMAQSVIDSQEKEIREMQEELTQLGGKPSVSEASDKPTGNAGHKHH